MAIPNLITLALLTPEVVRLTKDYKKTGKSMAGGGNYANFHQCKPL
jgi:Na+/alanine symporter